MLSIKGIDPFRALARESAKLFETRSQSIRAVTHKNNIAEVDIDYIAVLAQDLPSGLKKGATLELKGKSRFEFGADGLIRKIVDIS